jgi:Uma2 family endonuclease
VFECLSVFNSDWQIPKHLNTQILKEGEPLMKKEFFTKEEYLDMEAAADYKSEYYDGEIFAMSEVTLQHSIICVNIYSIIGKAIHDRNFVGFESSMKLEIEEANAYVYPDAMVVWGDIKISEKTNHAVKNPVLIVEVLSPSTESFDRGKKFEYYRGIATLKEYVLVSQDNAMVEIFYKQDKHKWQYSVVEGLENIVAFQSLDYKFVLKDIYHKVSLIRGQQ